MSTKSTRSRSAKQGRQAPKKQSWTALWVVLGVALLLVSVVALIQLSSAGGTALDGVQTFAVQQGHTSAPVTYAQTPPVGGEHDPAWQNCGIYAQPVENRYAVHALEHGAVWLTYRPDLAADAVQQVQALVRGRPYTLMSPYPALPAPVVASAWGLQLQATGPDDPRLPLFIAKYAQGLQTPEPGAPCSGGIGTPTSR